MRRSLEKEMMDLPDQPKELLQQDLRNLTIINRYLGGYRGVMRAVARLVEEQKLARFSLLDVGAGSGDIPARIATRIRKKRIAARLVAIETEPVTVAVAAEKTRDYPEISLVQGDAMALPFRAASFDFVLASQLLHHFSEDNVVTLLRTWSKVARRAIIVSDLVRHPLAYYGIRAITRLFTRNVMTLTDAPLSVWRAFTMAEWRELFRRADVGQFEIFWVFPFRVMALISIRS
jgi:SAM-dependent methyltransferase